MSVPTSSEQSPRGVRVALLAAYLNNEYEWAICRGARTAVEVRGGSVLFVAGATLSEPKPQHRARASLFDLIDSTTADAVLSVSSVIGHLIGPQAMATWLRRYGLPVSSVGAVDGIPSVGIDDAEGVGQVIEHLVLQHGRRKIAFITGTPTNREAIARLAAYSNGLAEYGLSFDPKLVLNGDFTREGGTRAVLELLDIRQVKLSEFDAIIASNDYSAFGAVDELVRRRIEVPGQVAVVGFDDIATARHHDPSLSTVRQPLEQLGRVAVDRLFQLLEGQSVVQTTQLSSELVLRRSCGCVPTEIPGAEPAAEGASPVNDEARALLPALAAEMNGKAGAFALALEPLLRRLAAGSTYQLERNRRLADELAARLRLARQDLIHERLHRLARALHTRMFSPRAELSTVLAERLPELGVEECVVSEFVPGRGKSELRLAFGFNSQDLNPHSQPYPSRELIPPGFPNLRKKSVLVLPLCYGDELLGIAVLPVVEGDGSLYEALAETFGVALKSMDLRRKLEARPG
jgi:phosphoserine phosphatase RsbU/P